MHVFASFNVAAQNADIIHWRKDYKLTPKDFRAAPIMRSKYGAISYIAVKYTASFKDTLSFQIYCAFYKNLSWINPNFLDSNLLEHEQGHFNLGEIFRQKLAIEFKKYIPRKGHISIDLNEIYLKVKTEMEILEKEYDAQCAFPPNQYLQKKWTKKIEGLLNN